MVCHLAFDCAGHQRCRSVRVSDFVESISDDVAYRRRQNRHLAARLSQLSTKQRRSRNRRSDFNFFISDNQFRVVGGEIVAGKLKEMIKNRLIFLSLIFLCLTIAACQNLKSNAPQLTPEDLTRTNWREIETKGRGATVNFAMWAGDENRNRFFQTFAAAALKRKYDITLNVVPLGDTADVISKLLNEKSAGKNANGSVDLIWINGENFRAAKQGDLLWGKFAENLPNNRYYEREAGKRDFGTTIEGLEAPWQRAQFVLAYDTGRFREPPRTIEALGEWIKAHPGRFTYIAPPDFTGSVFLRHILYHFGGGAEKFQTFDEELYQSASAKTFAFLNEIKPFLWRGGETFPNSTKELDRLFANNEVDFSFAYGANFATERIKRGEYPPTVRTFVFDSGTIGNYNFLTIPFNASNPAGALVVINYLMSPEFQIEQSKQLGSVYPHNLEALDDTEKRAAGELERGAATLSDAELAAHLVPEADSEYLERLEKDWREKVLLGGK